MCDHVERLREAKREDDIKSYSAGDGLGTAWAARKARFWQLRNIHRWFDYADLDSLFETNTFRAPDELGQKLFTAINGDKPKSINGRPIDYGEFWSECLGDYWDEDVDDPQLLRGFVGGALKVFLEFTLY